MTWSIFVSTNKTIAVVAVEIICRLFFQDDLDYIVTVNGPYCTSFWTADVRRGTGWHLVPQTHSTWHKDHFEQNKQFDRAVVFPAGPIKEPSAILKALKAKIKHENAKIIPDVLNRTDYWINLWK